MKILFLTTDLYLNVAGGGQELMRKVIQSIPEFNFFYYVDKEPDDFNRPLNCFVIKLSQLVEVRFENQYNLNSIEKSAFKISNQFARSAKNLEFDLIEIPDYNFFGSFIRTTFKKNNIKFKFLIINLLGNISSTMERNWAQGNNLEIEVIKNLEINQFLSADFSYSLSERYIKDWQKLTRKNIFNINPLNLIDVENKLKKINPIGNIKPNLLFLGRFEKRKGPDIFIKICNKINKDLYHKILMYGDDDFSDNGKSAISQILILSKEYNLNVNINKSVSNAELVNLYQGINILILPVRYDTFNLIALDALFNGCILFVSNNAGFCDYIDSNFPNLKYYVFDIENIDNLHTLIEDKLKNFYHYKNEIIVELSKITHINSLKEEMMNFYLDSFSSNLELNLSHQEYSYKEVSFSLKYYLINLLKKYGTQKFYEKILFIRKNILKKFK